MKNSAELNLDFLAATAREAGKAILEVYETDFEVESKADESPLTEADLRAHRLISRRLHERYPHVPILSEESSQQAAYEIRKDWPMYWLVDPLDGTKEFVKRNGQFTVNIALIENNRPTVGVVYAPVLDWLYLGSPAGGHKIEGDGAPMPLAPPVEKNGDKLVVVGSRSHPSEELTAFVEEQKKNYAEVEFVAMGSSLKLCMVAEGKADIYPRFGPTMEWDTAAAHAVVSASGRRVIAHGTDDDLPYNKENLLNGWFVVK